MSTAAAFTPYAAIALVDAGHPRAEAADLLAKKYADHPEVTAEDINDCFDDIEELKADGKLFAEDIYADHAFDFKNRSTVVKALCLHVAHTCIRPDWPWNLPWAAKRRLTFSAANR